MRRLPGSKGTGAAVVWSGYEVAVRSRSSFARLGFEHRGVPLGEGRGGDRHVEQQRFTGHGSVAQAFALVLRRVCAIRVHAAVPMRHRCFTGTAAVRPP